MSPRGWQRLLLAIVLIGLGALVVRETSPSGSSGTTAIGHAPSGVTVLAVVSIAPAIIAMAPDDRLSSGNSDALAAQVIEGVPADVLISADLKIPAALHGKGLAEVPVVIGHDRLVVITPAGNPARIHSVSDLQQHGVRLVIGTAGSPIGRYTRAALAKLSLSGALRNVVSNAPDASTITTDVVLGDATAGVVYQSQAQGLGTKVKVIGIPAAAQPVINDSAVALVYAPHPAAAAAFVAYLLGPNGQAYLRRYGFLAP
jgi:molybdate transport system substrate-binding protein